MAADHRQAGSLWTPEEDVVLLRHVAKYGTKHWGYLQTSGVLPHRDQKACCNRFILLKRKFFQARSKGQRLTFPVAPQSESATSLRRATTLSSLKASPLSTFKKPLCSGPAALKLPEASTISMLQGRCQSADVKLKETSSSGGQVEQGHFEKLVEKLPTPKPESPVALLGPAQPTLNLRSPVPKPEFSPHDEKMPALVDVPLPVRTPELQLPANAISPLPAQSTHSQSSAFHLVLPQAGLSQPRAPQPSSTMWRFNAGVSEAAPLDFPSDDPACQLDAARIPMSHPSGSSTFSPDALLDQMATAPAQMMFGNRAPGTSSSAAATPTSSAGFHPSGDLLAQAADAASLWESPNSCSDLWELMRSAASV